MKNKARKIRQAQQRSPRRLILFVVAVALVFAAVAAFVFVGRGMIRSSPVFEIAQATVQAKYGGVAGALDVRPFAPFRFAEGETSGRANFTLSRGGRCYPISASKEAGKWLVNVQGETGC